MADPSSTPSALIFFWWANSRRAEVSLTYGTVSCFFFMLLSSHFRINKCLRTSRINYATLTRSQSENRTIFALSTPPGKGGIAVVRISGPEVHSVWRRIVKPLSVSAMESPPLSRIVRRCSIVDKAADGTEETLDDGLAIFFKGALLTHNLKPSTYAIAFNQHQDHLLLKMFWNYMYTLHPLSCVAYLGCCLLFPVFELLREESLRKGPI